MDHSRCCGHRDHPCTKGQKGETAVSPLLQLFLSFLQVGLFSIGGGYAAIPLIQSQSVEIHHWLTAEQFLDLATIAEMTPGPIAVNAATFVGLKVSGLPGALLATFGCILPSLVIVSLLSYIYAHYRELPMLQSVLSSLRPAVVALITSAGLSMLFQVIFGTTSFLLISQFNLQGFLLFGCAFFALRRFRLNPILVMVLCGAVSLLLGLIYSP
ncbi:MAG: chromate transporter [Clostridiales bacterium]|nr:chromate transporter [Clostridiales bacterium]